MHFAFGKIDADIYILHSGASTLRSEQSRNGKSDLEAVDGGNGWHFEALPAGCVGVWGGRVRTEQSA